MLPIVSLILGFALLVIGAEALVRGATRIALAAGLSRLVIGLTVVALGTSTPEIAVSVGASLEGNADLALGNVVGSNTFNVLFILGLAALIAPLAVRRRLVRLDIPLMFAMGLVLLIMAIDGRLGLIDGVILLALAVGYMVLNLRLGRKEAVQEEQGSDGADVAVPVWKGTLLAIAFILVGLVGLVIGARFTVDGAVQIARTLGASDLVIGLTIVAAGTSLPEVATSVLAAIRGERDIAIGNVVGSNILNIAVILGLSSVVAQDGLAIARGALTFDIPVMLAVSLALLPIAFTGQLIARWEGGVFFAYYVAYVAYLFLTSTVHPSADALAFALTWFAFPLTLIVVAAAVVREMRIRKGQRTR